MLTVLLVPAGAHGDVAGELIEFFEKDKIIHIACDFGDGYAVAMEFCGCWIRPTSYYSNPEIKKLPLTLTSDQEAAVRQWLYTEVGSGYAYEQLLADALELHHAHGHDERGKYTCSGLVAAALFNTKGVVYPFGAKPPAEVTPADFDAVYQSTVEVKPEVSTGI